VSLGKTIFIENGEAIRRFFDRISSLSKRKQKIFRSFFGAGKPRSLARARIMRARLRKRESEKRIDRSQTFF